MPETLINEPPSIHELAKREQEKGKSEGRIERALQIADQRFGQALWYAFGVADVRPDLKDRMRNTRGHEHTFAQLHRNETFLFYMDNEVALSSVQDAFSKWIESLPK